MNAKLQTIRTISNRLARALAVLVLLFIGCAFYVYSSENELLTAAPLVAFACGVIGGFVGLQRRLKSLSDDDLALLANSWVYICLSPLVGGILAVVIYVLFISGLLAGDLFPRFAPPEHLPQGDVPVGLRIIFTVTGQPADYAKMMFWCFVAGFSERFATDIISRFESRATEKGKPES